MGANNNEASGSHLHFYPKYIEIKEWKIYIKAQLIFHNKSKIHCFQSGILPLSKVLWSLG